YAGFERRGRARREQRVGGACFQLARERFADDERDLAGDTVGDGERHGARRALGEEVLVGGLRLRDTDREDHLFAERLLEPGGDCERDVVVRGDVVNERHRSCSSGASTTRHASRFPRRPVTALLQATSSTLIVTGCSVGWSRGTMSPTWRPTISVDESS